MSQGDPVHPPPTKREKEREKGGGGRERQGGRKRDYKVCGGTAHELTHKLIIKSSSLDSFFQKSHDRTEEVSWSD